MTENNHQRWRHYQFAKSSIRLSSLSSSSSNNDNEISSDVNDTSSNYVYKDDCFGFLSFLCGIAVGDVEFTTIFISLSLFAALLTKLKVLPRDFKRPTIATRKISGIIALVTLLLTTHGVFIDNSNQSILDTFLIPIIGFDDIPTPPDIELATKIQLLIGGFSILTTLPFDIRWRDRFDYPEEFM